MYANPDGDIICVGMYEYPDESMWPNEEDIIYVLSVFSVKFKGV